MKNRIIFPILASALLLSGCAVPEQSKGQISATQTEMAEDPPNSSGVIAGVAIGVIVMAVVVNIMMNDFLDEAFPE